MTRRCRALTVAASAVLLSLAFAAPTLAQGAAGGLSVTLTGSDLSPHEGESFAYVARVTNAGSTTPPAPSCRSLSHRASATPAFSRPRVAPPPRCWEG